MDKVVIGSIAAVVATIIIAIYLAFKGIKLINSSSPGEKH